MSLTSDQAFDLSKRFRQLSVGFGNYRIEHWDSLTGNQRRDIEDVEWDLLALSSVIRTAAVGLVLTESETSLQALTRGTNKAKRAIGRLDKVRKVINLAASVVGLAGAVIARNPQAIAKNIGTVVEAAEA